MDADFVIWIYYSALVYSGSYIESYFIYIALYALNLIYVMKYMLYVLKFAKGCDNLTNSGGGNHI
jgi:hypothetical protein